MTAKVAIPALVRGDELITATGLFGESIRMAQRVENGAARTVGGDVHRQPVHRCAGAADLQLRRDRQRSGAGGTRGDAHRRGLLGESREDAGAAGEPGGDGAASRWPTRGGTVALVDAADATSSGASGDSNAILRKLMEAGYAGTHVAAHRRCAGGGDGVRGRDWGDDSHHSRRHARPGAFHAAADHGDGAAARRTAGSAASRSARNGSPGRRRCWSRQLHARRQQPRGEPL